MNLLKTCIYIMFNTLIGIAILVPFLAVTGAFVYYTGIWGMIVTSIHTTQGFWGWIWWSIKMIFGVVVTILLFGGLMFGAASTIVVAGVKAQKKK